MKTFKPKLEALEGRFQLSAAGAHVLYQDVVIPETTTVVTGRVTAVAADPADATGNTYYVGTTNGGVWKTSNGGTGCG